MGDFQWYQDDTICHNCHNHCSLLEPNCDVGKNTAERKRRKEAEAQRRDDRSDTMTCS